MPKVLITGATGFLGGKAARLLRECGWEVTTTGRNPAAGHTLSADGFAFHPCDLTRQADRLPAMVAGCDAVVHCAALSSPWGDSAVFHHANVTATANVLAACQRNHVSRLIFISSPSVLFDYRDQRELKEAIPWKNPPANPYIASKREAENLLKQADMPKAIILRPKGLIGPGDTTLVPRVMRVAKRGSFPVFSHRDPLLDLTTIDDAVRAIHLAIEAAPEHEGKTYHVTSGQALPSSLAFRALFDGAGLCPRVRHVPLARALRIAGWMEWLSRAATGGRWEPPITRYGVGALAFSQTLSIDAIRRDLGYQPGPCRLEDCLYACGEFWRIHPPRSR